MAAPTVDNPRRKKSFGLAPKAGGGKTVKTSPLAKKRLQHAKDMMSARPQERITARQKARAEHAIQIGSAPASRPVMRTTSGGGGNSKRAM